MPGILQEILGRAVRQGSRGIALLYTSRGASQIKYVFDIADTVERQNAKRPIFGSGPKITKGPLRRSSPTATVFLIGANRFA